MQFSGRKFKIIAIKMLTVVREQYKNLVNLSTEREKSKILNRCHVTEGTITELK